MSTTSGWFSVMAFAIFWRMIVFPAWAATRSSRLSLPPRKQIDDAGRDVRFFVSSKSLSSGYSGVRLSKSVFSFATSGSRS